MKNFMLIRIAALCLGVFSFFIHPNTVAAQETAGYEWVVQPTYKYVGNVQENGLMAVEQDSRWGFINQKGVEVIALEYNYSYGQPYFKEGLVLLIKNYKRGFINELGEEIVKQWYNGAMPFNGGFAAVFTSGRGWGFIDKTGKETVPPIYNDVSYFCDGLASVKKGNVWGFIDKTGKEVIAPQYDSADDFKNGATLVTQDGRAFYINKDGQEIPRPADKPKVPKAKGLYHTPSAPYGYQDETGKLVIPEQYGAAGDFSEGVAWVKQKGEYFFINEKGERLTQGSFEALGEMHEGFARAKRDGKWGFIRLTGFKPCNITLSYLENYTGAVLPSSQPTIKVRVMSPTRPDVVSIVNDAGGVFTPTMSKRFGINEPTPSKTDGNLYDYDIPVGLQSGIANTLTLNVKVGSCNVSATPIVVQCAQKGSRKALLIGNIKYKAEGCSFRNEAATNIENDVKDMADSLRSLGFEVEKQYNLSLDSTMSVLQTFKKRIKAGDEVVFYYSGHGCDINKREYIIPTDCPNNKGLDTVVLDKKAIRLEEVYSYIQATSGTKILIIDACRNNVFNKDFNVDDVRPATTATERTWAKQNIIVQRAAVEGVRASAQGDGHSEFTTVLLKYIKQKNKTIVEILKTVNDEYQKGEFTPINLPQKLPLWVR